MKEGRKGQHALGNQNYADACGLAILCVGITLGYLEFSWLYVFALALVGTVVFFLFLKKSAGPQLLSLHRVGPAGMYVLQVLNALGLFGVGRLIRWLIA